MKLCNTNPYCETKKSIYIPTSITKTYKIEICDSMYNIDGCTPEQFSNMMATALSPLHLLHSLGQLLPMVWYSMFVLIVVDKIYVEIWMYR